jgi:hypothetical protein
MHRPGSRSRRLRVKGGNRKSSRSTCAVAGDLEKRSKGLKLAAGAPWRRTRGAWSCIMRHFCESGWLDMEPPSLSGLCGRCPGAHVDTPGSAQPGPLVRATWPSVAKTTPPEPVAFSVEVRRRFVPLRVGAGFERRSCVVVGGQVAGCGLRRRLCSRRRLWAVAARWSSAWQACRPRRRNWRRLPRSLRVPLMGSMVAPRLR